MIKDDGKRSYIHITGAKERPNEIKTATQRINEKNQYFEYYFFYLCCCCPSGAGSLWNNIIGLMNFDALCVCDVAFKLVKVPCYELNGAFCLLFFFSEKKSLFVLMSTNLFAFTSFKQHSSIGSSIGSGSTPIQFWNGHYVKWVGTLFGVLTLTCVEARACVRLSRVNLTSSWHYKYLVDHRSIMQVI